MGCTDFCGHIFICILNNDYKKYHSIQGIHLYLCVLCAVYVIAYKLVSGNAFHYTLLLFYCSLPSFPYIHCCHSLSLVNIDLFDLVIYRSRELFGHSNCCMTNVMSAHHKIKLKCIATKCIDMQSNGIHWRGGNWHGNLSASKNVEKNSRMCVLRECRKKLFVSQKVHTQQSARNSYDLGSYNPS